LQTLLTSSIQQLLADKHLWKQAELNWELGRVSNQLSDAVGGKEYPRQNK
jgi:hypothetical protein